MTTPVYDDVTTYHHELSVLSSNGERIAALLVEQEPTVEYDFAQIELTFADKKYTAEADNFFMALREIRKDLEKDGFLICCQGAREDVYPSPMMLSMGTGGIAYVLQLGVHATRANFVRIFDPIPDTEPEIVPTTIAVQDEFYRKWLESSKK